MACVETRSKGGKCFGGVVYFKSGDLTRLLHYYLVEQFVIHVYWQHLQRIPAFQQLYLLPAVTECCKLLNLDKPAFNFVTDSQFMHSRYAFEI